MNSLEIAEKMYLCKKHTRKIEHLFIWKKKQKEETEEQKPIYELTLLKPQKA